MLSVRTINYNRIFNRKDALKTILLNKYTTSSTQPAVQDDQAQYTKQLKDFDTLINITKKVRQKKPQKPPFVKNICLGIVDTDILTYPQLKMDDAKNLVRDVSQIEKLLKQQHMISCETLSNKNFRQNLSDYKAIGLQASQFLDGREYNMMESCRFLEALSEHNLRDSLVHNEQLGVQTLIKFASDSLKKKYLVPLMKGAWLSSFCISEHTMSNIFSMKTTSELSKDKKTWIINGEKSWVVNGVSADVLIVFAVSKIVHKGATKEQEITAFVVEKGFSGISYKKIENCGMEIADITFNNTPVPVENVIGELGKADQIFSSILTELRLSTGTCSAALTKKILNGLSQHILEQTDDTNVLNEADAVREKIAEITTALYGIESVVYLTAGLIDSYENQDCELECAIVKVFSSENCLKSSLTCLDLIGTVAVSDSHWAKQLHMESLRYLTLYETNNSLKMIIALLGLQFAGKEWNDKINKLRNPLFHANFIFKRMWTNRKNDEDNPKLDLRLGEYLHQSLHDPSQHLEYCVKRIQYATEMLLAKHGPEVINKHMSLRRLADCIIDVYVMTASLGRASRAYCIGLQHGHYEMMIASVFCASAMERVKKNVNKILVSEHLINNESNRVLAKKVFKFKGYFPKHPLSRDY